MTSDITYGPALLLAQAYHENDEELFSLLQQTLTTGTIASSTFQLCDFLLQVTPRGDRREGKSQDIREEVLDDFAEILSKGTAHAAFFSNSDPLDIATATTTIFMGDILPLMQQNVNPVVSQVYEGIDDRGFCVILASIADAAIQSFMNYVPLINTFSNLGSHPSYAECVISLQKLLPALEFEK